MKKKATLTVGERPDSNQVLVPNPHTWEIDSHEHEGTSQSSKEGGDGLEDSFEHGGGKVRGPGNG